MARFEDLKGAALIVSWRGMSTSRRRSPLYDKMGMCEWRRPASSVGSKDPFCNVRERYYGYYPRRQKERAPLGAVDLARKESSSVLKKLKRAVVCRQYPTWTVILHYHSQSISGWSFFVMFICTFVCVMRPGSGAFTCCRAVFVVLCKACALAHQHQQ